MANLPMAPREIIHFFDFVNLVLHMILLKERIQQLIIHLKTTDPKEWMDRLSIEIFRDLRQ